MAPAKPEVVVNLFIKQIKRKFQRLHLSPVSVDLTQTQTPADIEGVGNSRWRPPNWSVCKRCSMADGESQLKTFGRNKYIFTYCELCDFAWWFDKARLHQHCSVIYYYYRFGGRHLEDSVLVDVGRWRRKICWNNRPWNLGVAVGISFLPVIQQKSQLLPVLTPPSWSFDVIWCRPVSVTGSLDQRPRIGYVGLAVRISFLSVTINELWKLPVWRPPSCIWKSSVLFIHLLTSLDSGWGYLWLRLKSETNVLD